MGSSSSFGGFNPRHRHLIEGPGGLAKEIKTLRDQTDAAFVTVEGLIAGETFSTLIGRMEIQAGAVNAIMTATASVIAPTTYTGAGGDFDGVLAPSTLDADIGLPKRFVLTVTGTGADWLGGTVHVIGLDADGVAQVEDIVSAANTGTTTGVKYWSSISSVALPACGNTGAATALGVASEPGCIVLSGVSSASAQDLTNNASFNRASLGNRVMTHAHAVTLVLSNHTDWDVGTMTVYGFDINGAAINEALSIPNNGNTTVNGAKFFAQVTHVHITAMTGAGGTYTLGIRDTIIGLPKLKADGAIAAVGIRELTRADSTAAWSVATPGTVTDAASALPNGSYTPNSGPNGISQRILVYIPG